MMKVMHFFSISLSSLFVFWTAKVYKLLSTSQTISYLSVTYSPPFPETMDTCEGLERTRPLWCTRQK